MLMVIMRTIIITVVIILIIIVIISLRHFLMTNHWDDNAQAIPYLKYWDIGVNPGGRGYISPSHTHSF